MKTRHHWKILVPIFGILCAMVMALNLYFIYKLNAGELFLSSSGGGDSQILSQKRAVQKVNEEFNSRSIALYDFATTTPVAIDPSI